MCLAFYLTSILKITVELGTNTSSKKSNEINEFPLVFHFAWQSRKSELPLHRCMYVGRIHSELKHNLFTKVELFQPYKKRSDVKAYYYYYFFAFGQ